MTAAPLGKVVGYVRRFANSAGMAAQSDGQLLERFLHQEDVAAFEVLVERHAGLVMGVCERVLRHRQDAEDAVQATFMVLVRQGSTMIGQGNLAGWLYGVALHTSLYARRQAARRRSVESQCNVPRAVGDASLDAIWRDLRLVLDDELGRLPSKYRDPLILCYLEGQTNEQAARILGWTKGTVSGRLARARDLLRARLTRRGLALSGVVLAAALSQQGAAAASTTLIQATVKAGAGFVAGTVTVSAPVALITDGVLQTMAISKLKLMLAAAGALGLVLAGSAYYGQAMFNLVGPSELIGGLRDDVPKDDQERIVGKWIAVEAERDGKREVDFGLPAGTKFQIEFTKDQMHFMDRAENGQIRYRLLPNKSSKMIELEIARAGEKNHKGLGLYAFEGDKLKLCLNNRDEEAPREFKAPAGTGFVVFVLRRAQPADKTDIAENAQVNQAMQRMSSANNLKQIMLALHNYLAANGRFPGVAITSTDGTPLLSWRVAILPYLEQDDLFKKFRLNEAWDSPHNKALVSKMPAVYARSGEGPKAPFKTNYRAFVGADAFFSGQGGRKLQDFPKGMSNTLAIFEAGEGVVWTAPEELTYTVDKPLPRFGHWFDNGFHVALCDGSVRIQAHKIDETTLRNLITVTGGEVIAVPHGTQPQAPGKGGVLRR